MMRPRKSGRRIEPQSDLLLAAMVDMMVNVLLFLLTLYGAGPTDWIGDMELAETPATEAPSGEVQLTISERNVAVEGNVVLTLAEAVTPGDVEEVEALLAARREMLPESPRLAVEIDRRTPWSVVQPLIAAAGEAGFTDLRFVVMSVEGP